jgi:hypothetical protein
MVAVEALADEVLNKDGKGLQIGLQYRNWLSVEVMTSVNREAEP